MSFLQTASHRVVPGIGPPGAKIAIVGEAPGAYEDAKLQPFVGPAGGVLEQCLHSAGLIRNEVYLTNVVKVKPHGNNIEPFFNSKAGTFSAEGIEWVKSLREELDERKPNIVVAAGKTALAALTGQTHITKYRGYVLETIELQHVKKCIPIIHPAACLYNQGGGDKGGISTSAKPYLYRYVITADLKKAKALSDTPELNRPARTLVYNFDTVDEVQEWLTYFAEQPLISFDIEVVNYEVSCIGLASSPMTAASIPIAGRWTEREECQIWKMLDSILGNPDIVKVGQNLIFDTHFLLTRCGIEVRGQLQDTMIAHSCIWPELPKSLGFLGSIYCGAQEYWKDMVKWENIKDES